MIETKICIDKDDAEDLAEYLALLLEGDIIDKHYQKEEGYKVYGHIKTFIEIFKKFNQEK
ncbi:MAG: hypothetical protein IMZ52_07785 [Actinobacteria bacterium]|nr:hypothetical protein [Actinomycetota bacterium]